MARLYLKKTLTGFEPADDASKDAWKKYKTGDVYRAEVVKPRSYQHHKLCFALLSLTYMNQERWTDFESFRKAVAIAAGHTEELVTVHGEVIRLPASLSYDTLDEVQFTDVFGRMMAVCSEILGVAAPELQWEVSKYAGELQAA